MGRRFPDGGLLRYRKWVPQQLGDVIVVTNSPPIGHMRSQLTYHQVGIVLDETSRHGQKNYIRCPDMVKRIGSHLGTSFPLFHGRGTHSWGTFRCQLQWFCDDFYIIKDAMHTLHCLKWPEVAPELNRCVPLCLCRQHSVLAEVGRVEAGVPVWSSAGPRHPQSPVCN